MIAKRRTYKKRKRKGINDTNHTSKNRKGGSINQELSFSMVSQQKVGKEGLTSDENKQTTEQAQAQATMPALVAAPAQRMLVTDTGAATGDATSPGPPPSSIGPGITGIQKQKQQDKQRISRKTSKDIPKGQKKRKIEKPITSSIGSMIDVTKFTSVLLMSLLGDITYNLIEPFENKKEDTVTLKNTLSMMFTNANLLK